jgi:hypothetical protein
MKPSGDSTAEKNVGMQPRKLAYTSPKLIVFGSVSKWTMGTRTRQMDGANTRRNPSDRNIKKNIIQVGFHPLGFGLYLFEYKPEYHDQWGSGRKFGVMADEVEKVMPQAVSIHPDGYKMVDYDLLGICLPDR